MNNDEYGTAGWDHAVEDARRAMAGITLPWYRTDVRLPADPELRRRWLTGYAIGLQRTLHSGDLAGPSGRPELDASLAHARTQQVAGLIPLDAMAAEADLLSQVLARPDAHEALEHILATPVGGPSCGCGDSHWSCGEDADDALFLGECFYCGRKISLDTANPQARWESAARITECETSPDGEHSPDEIDDTGRTITESERGGLTAG